MAAAAAAAAMAVAVKSAVAAGEGGRAEGVEMSEGGCPRSPPGGVKMMIEGLEARELDFTHLHTIISIKSIISPLIACYK